MVPVRMKKPSKPEFWVLFPRLLPSFNILQLNEVTYDVYESLESRSTGGFPGESFHGLSPVASFPSHWKAQYGKVAWKMSSSASYLGCPSLTVVDPPGGVWLGGELSYDASRWSEKFKTIPRRFEKRSKNRFLGEIFFKEYLQTGSVAAWKHWIIWGIANKTRKAAIRGGWRMMISVGVILSLGGRPSGLFIFVFLLDM